MDYDIDKLYLLGYQLDDYGRLVTNTESEYTREVALRNSVVDRITQLLNQPRLQTYAHMPISLDAWRELAANSTLGKKEQTMTSDNPMTKFIMQVANMVGKDVIGVSAVGMKVFFAATAYMNDRITDLRDAIINNDNNKIVNALIDLAFPDPLKPNELTTLANVNFEPIEALLTENPIYINFNYADPNNKTVQLLKNFGSLQNIIEVLKMKSSMMDGPESISGLISSATDNAKELILKKINATVDFADAWTYLMSTGHPIEEIAKLMQSPQLNEVNRYTRKNVFTTTVKNTNVERAIQFLLNEKQLPGADVLNLKFIMNAYRTGKTDNKSFINKLLYETKDGEIVLDSNGNPKERNSSVLNKAAKELGISLTETGIEKAGAFKKGSDFRSKIFDLLKYNAAVDILLEHIAYLLNHSKTSRSEDLYEQYQESDFNRLYEEDLAAQEMEEYYDIEARLQNTDFEYGNTPEISALQYRSIYRYLRDYVKSRNKFVASNPNNTILENYLKNIIPGTKEQQINGMMLGINQGMNTNQQKLWSNLRRLEVFVNEMVKADDKFSILQALNDDNYLQMWINRYDNVKVSINPLKLVTSLPNFNAMYRLNLLAVDQMRHSSIVELNEKLAYHLLPEGVWSADKYKVLTKYTRDVLITNWIQQLDFEINLPQITAMGSGLATKKPFPAYSSNIKGESRLITGPTSFNLTTAEGRATFVNLFNNWIVPHLKATRGNNAFVRNISFSWIPSRVHNQNIKHARINMNMSDIDASAATRQRYSEMLDGLLRIQNEVLPEIGLTVGDAILLYNSIVYKNSFAEHGFTQLLEAVSSNGRNRLVNHYFDYISKLDASKNRNFEINNNGDFTFNGVQGNIKDLKYRLGFSKNPSKFGIVLERDASGAIAFMYETDAFGTKKDKAPTNVKAININTFTGEMPVYEKMNSTPIKDSYEKPTTFFKHTDFSRTIIDEIIDKLELQDSVIFTTVQELHNWYEDSKSDTGIQPDIVIRSKKELDTMSASSGFIYDGKIYLNQDMLSPETALHEISHLIMAAMRFSRIPETRDRYYELINQADSILMNHPKLKQRMSLYSHLKASDFREEVIANLFEMGFKDSLDNLLGTSIRQGVTAKDAISDVLNEIFDITIPNNINYEKLGFTTIPTIMTIFHSAQFDEDRNLFVNNLQHSGNLRAIKQTMINHFGKTYRDKNGKEIPYANTIKYDC